MTSMPRQKNQLQSPRRKRMTREDRLQSATAARWVERYQGKDIIKDYSKWFAVDPLCALTELKILGVRIDDERERQIRDLIQARAGTRRRRKGSPAEDHNADCDETFAQIIGVHSGKRAVWRHVGGNRRASNCHDHRTAHRSLVAEQVLHAEGQ